MRICEVIGNLTLNRGHPSLRGAVWRIAVPLSVDAASRKLKKRGEPFVVYDELGAGIGSLIGVSEGAEASAPFYPDQKPIDGYCAAILDTCEITDPA
jgi:ethanolamine utilization protein EutN